jgi:hypothetical protein
MLAYWKLSPSHRAAGESVGRFQRAARSGQLMKGLLPINLHEVEGLKVSPEQGAVVE